MKTLLFALILCVPFAAIGADDSDGPMTIPGLMCTDEMCILPAEVMATLIDVHNKHVRHIRELEAAQSAPPTCAKVEPVEPPKKKLPPIKRENDT